MGKNSHTLWSLRSCESVVRRQQVQSARHCWCIVYLTAKAGPLPPLVGVGVVAVMLEALLSGLSNVYFEKVLKSTELSLWERNVQLAGYSLLI